MRVLIVGATGFVGGHLLAACRERGDTLVGTYRPGETLPPGDDVEWRAVDLLDSAMIRSAVSAAKPEGVVHLAAQANVGEALRDPVTTFRVNAEGTVRVLDAVRGEAPDARVVVVTSAEVYGHVSSEDLPVTEDHPMAPQSPYGLSKAAADLAASQAHRAWGLHVVRMRPFNHVGPGQRLGFVAPDFASQVAAIERGMTPAVLRVGNLSARRDFTDVRDIVLGYRSALEHGGAGRAYNLCSGTSISIEDIVRLFLEESSVDIRLETDESRFRPVDVPEFRGDASRAEHELGWRARIPLQRSLADVLEEQRRLPTRERHPSR